MRLESIQLLVKTIQDFASENGKMFFDWRFYFGHYYCNSGF